MTTPPVDPTVGTLVELSHAVRTAGDVQRRRVHALYLATLACALAVLAYGGYVVHAYLEERLLKAELQAPVYETRIAAANVATDVWRKQALALAAVRRVDTVHTDSIITHTTTRVVTVPIPVTARDGTVSIVPMAVVPAASFASLADACTRERHDCTAQLAAKDTLLAIAQTRITNTDSLFENAATQLRLTKRASWWAKWGYGGAGFATGFTAGTLACRR